MAKSPAGSGSSSATSARTRGSTATSPSARRTPEPRFGVLSPVVGVVDPAGEDRRAGGRPGADGALRLRRAGADRRRGDRLRGVLRAARGVHLLGGRARLSAVHRPAVASAVGRLHERAGQRQPRGHPGGVGRRDRQPRRRATSSSSAGGKTFTVATPQPGTNTYKLSVPAEQVPAGTHTLIARAVDRVGNFSTATAAITLTLADRDGDGVLEDTDCNDRAPLNQARRDRDPRQRRRRGLQRRRHPPHRRRELPEPVAREHEDHQGDDAQGPRRAPGARVELRCAGRGCPFSVRRFNAKGGARLDLRKQYFPQGQAAGRGDARDPRACARVQRQGRASRCASAGRR